MILCIKFVQCSMILEFFWCLPGNCLRHSNFEITKVQMKSETFFRNEFLFQTSRGSNPLQSVVVYFTTDKKKCNKNKTKLNAPYQIAKPFIQNFVDEPKGQAGPPQTSMMETLQQELTGKRCYFLLKNSLSQIFPGFLATPCGPQSLLISSQRIFSEVVVNWNKCSPTWSWEEKKPSEVFGKAGIHMICWCFLNAVCFYVDISL